MWKLGESERKDINRYICSRDRPPGGWMPELVLVSFFTNSPYTYTVNIFLKGLLNMTLPVLLHTYIKPRIFPDIGHFAFERPWAFYFWRSPGSHRASLPSRCICCFSLLSIDIWRVRRSNYPFHLVHPETSSSATLYPLHCVYPAFFTIVNSVQLIHKVLTGSSKNG